MATCTTVDVTRKVGLARRAAFNDNMKDERNDAKLTAAVENLLCRSPRVRASGRLDRGAVELWATREPAHCRRWDAHAKGVLRRRACGPGCRPSPDFGIYTAKQVQKGRPREGQIPARGVVEVKGVGDDAWLTADGDQVSRYWGLYRLVLVTNTCDFVLVGEDAAGPSFEARNVPAWLTVPRRSTRILA